MDQVNLEAHTTIQNLSKGIDVSDATVVKVVQTEINDKRMTEFIVQPGDLYDYFDEPDFQSSYFSFHGYHTHPFSFCDDLIL